VCAAPLKKLVADQVTNDGARMEARRIKYGRQDYHLFVRAGGSTAGRCADLFGVAPTRVKLLAGGRRLATEAEVAAAAAEGAPILLVGTRKADVVGLCRLTLG